MKQHLFSVSAITALCLWAAAVTPVRADESVTNSGFVECDYYILTYDWKLHDRQRAEKQAFMPKEDSLVFAGHVMKITQGQAPLNMDPMETSAQRELDFEKYRRVELIGNGTGVFVSEGEGVGCHLSRVSPDAAFFVKASDNSVGLAFSSSFK